MLFSSYLYAYKAEYYVKSMGIKVSYISISNDIEAGLLEFKTHSLKTSRLFPQLNNTYRIEYDDQLRPILASRTINQKNLNETITVEYNHPALSAKMIRSSATVNELYPIVNNIRDVFSFLNFVSSGKASAGVYPIDGNGVLFLAKVIPADTEMVKTSIGNYKAKRYDISFSNTTGIKMPYLDMVTNNMLNENTKLSLWVSNKIPVKAYVRKKGLSMVWELVSIQN
ncbi:MAG: hypothetical protein PHO32_03605 [Candidatus Cloacimonetes bacterium]|nr:hypothetical protein [Candidatus Cloacimonadota bacterium]